MKNLQRFFSTFRINRHNYDISVIAHYGYSVPELAYRIQQTIKQMVESMTKYKIAKVDVHVQSVVFPKPKAEEGEPAPEGDKQDGDKMDN